MSCTHALFLVWLGSCSIYVRDKYFLSDRSMSIMMMITAKTNESINLKTMTLHCQRTLGLRSLPFLPSSAANKFCDFGECILLLWINCLSHLLKWCWKYCLFWISENWKRNMWENALEIKSSRGGEETRGIIPPKKTCEKEIKGIY